MFHDAPKQVIKATYIMNFSNVFDKQNIKTKIAGLSQDCCQDN